MSPLGSALGAGFHPSFLGNHSGGHDMVCQRRSNDEALVSIIVLTKNRKELLRSCLLSLFKQSYKNFEVVVVDDFSVDGTEALLAHLSKQHNNLSFCKNEGRGLGAGRNTGLRRARGEIIAFLDDDCIASEDWLLEGIKCMNNENADIVRGAVVHPDGTLYSELRRDALRFGTGNIMYKKKVIYTLGGFDDRFVYGSEDRDLGYRAISKGYKLAVAPKAIVYHPKHSQNIVSGIKRAITVEIFRSINRPLLYKKHPSLRKELWRGVFLNKYHAGFSVLLLGILTGGLLVVNSVNSTIYLSLFFTGAFPYMKMRIAPDKNLLRYPKRFFALPYFVFLDFIATMGTVIGAIRYRCLLV